jgi:hypothetical protein
MYRRPLRRKTLNALLQIAWLGDSMAKNILIFADGTGQIGGLRPDQRLSNVYKMRRQGGCADCWDSHVGHNQGFSSYRCN